jgi:hypothetical protein
MLKDKLKTGHSIPVHKLWGKETPFSNCGQDVSSDREASLAIVIKSPLVRKRNKYTQILEGGALFQFTSRPVHTNGLPGSDEGAKLRRGAPWGGSYGKPPIRC